MLASRSVQELLDAFASPTPTPGGGSAAALAGATAASLLAMVAGMPKSRNNTPEDRTALDSALPVLQSLRAELTALIDRDAEAYDTVVAAYRRPKATDDEKAARKTAIAAAMRLATDVPLQTARAAASVVEQGAVVANHGNPNANSDAGVALSLAMTALSGAYMNVEINLGAGSDADYAATVRKELEELMRSSSAHISTGFTGLGWKDHQPPH